MYVTLVISSPERPLFTAQRKMGKLECGAGHFLSVQVGSVRMHVYMCDRVLGTPIAKRKGCGRSSLQVWKGPIKETPGQKGARLVMYKSRAGAGQGVYPH